MFNRVNTFKKQLSLCALLLFLLVPIIGCSTGSTRIAKEVEPLTIPIYKNASIGAFDINRVLSKRNDYIFKGTIKSISEHEITWLTAGNEKHDEFLSVCDVEVEKVIYGILKKPGEIIKVVNYQTSRQRTELEYSLMKNCEYYFITHIFDDDDKNRHMTNPDNQLQEYLLGDTYLDGTLSYLFPVSNNKVSFRVDWLIANAEKPKSSDKNILEGTTAIMDDALFETAITELILKYKLQ